MRPISRAILLCISLSATQFAIAEKANKPVGITASLSSITVKHKNKNITIKRDQNNSATVTSSFALTSRPCPPFCINPMHLTKDVQTLGEVEILDYLKKMQNDPSILVIDSRTPDGLTLKGTIPGSVNISWLSLNPAKGATTENIINIMQEKFNVKLSKGVDALEVDEAIVNGGVDKVFDYRNAKTLVMFCNGMWCGQSPSNIKTLLKFGYPAEKIKWYRGGMQNWEILGLTTVKP